MLELIPWMVLVDCFAAARDLDAFDALAPTEVKNSLNSPVSS